MEESGSSASTADGRYLQLSSTLGVESLPDRVQGRCSHGHRKANMTQMTGATASGFKQQGLSSSPASSGRDEMLNRLEWSASRPLVSVSRACPTPATQQLSLQIQCREKWRRQQRAFWSEVPSLDFSGWPDKFANPLNRVR